MKAMSLDKPAQRPFNIENIIEGVFDFDEFLPRFRTGVRTMPHCFKLAYRMVYTIYLCSRKTSDLKKADASYSRIVEHRTKMDDIRFEEWSRDPRFYEEAKKIYLQQIKAVAEACANRPSKISRQVSNEMRIGIGLKKGMPLYEIEAALKNQS